MPPMKGRKLASSMGLEHRGAMNALRSTHPPVAGRHSICMPGSDPLLLCKAHVKSRRGVSLESAHPAVLYIPESINDNHERSTRHGEPLNAHSQALAGQYQSQRWKAVRGSPILGYKAMISLNAICLMVPSIRSSPSCLIPSLCSRTKRPF